MDITCFHYTYTYYAYVWKHFAHLDHVNYRMKQFNLMSSSSGSGNLSIQYLYHVSMKELFQFYCYIHDVQAYV